MKSVKYLIILFLFLLIGCGVNPSEIPKNELFKYSKKIQYFKDDRTGLCFAIVASMKDMSLIQEGLAMAEVDCSSLKH